MVASKLRPCVFFDRDGVINLSPGPSYVLSWQEFAFTPGIISVLKWVKQQGFPIILITSQRGVGKGLMSMQDLDRIHDNMQLQLKSQAAHFDAIYAYTETPDCINLAKPDPQMLFAAASDLKLDLHQSLMIGDSDRDIVMGNNADLLHCIRFLSDKSPAVKADFTVSDSLELQKVLEKILL
ncbi:MAG: HAD-IIIA family hydrolase [Verrucomicrobiales bacterium]|nr:HAD-IIIA family hydrolase [Verrucomicrobiales bacterium]